MDNQALFDKYDLLIPSKMDGGYLIIAIDEKIRSGDLEDFFTTHQIDEVLIEISLRFQQDSVPHWSRIKDNLLHYFIRNHADEPGKYFLTDYARAVVEMMRNKLENPYKHLPLKKSFESTFFLRFAEIQTIEDLERKFGRLFISGPKKVVQDHLEGLEEELREAYKTLNQLLESEAHEALPLVKSFALTFRKFGDRAEDITDAMRSKDKFLKDLELVVDTFYAIVAGQSRFDDSELTSIQKMDDWKRARVISEDLKDFFIEVDRKVNAIRRQIYSASEKLSELQEYFSTRFNYRLQVQKLLSLALQTATYSEAGISFTNDFPLKSLVGVQGKMFYLRHLEFASKKPNAVIISPPDENYEAEEQGKIEQEINRQLIINHWVKKAKERLAVNKPFLMKELLDTIWLAEKDLSIVYGVGSEMIAFVSEEPTLSIEITPTLTQLQENNLFLWKMKFNA